MFKQVYRHIILFSVFQWVMFLGAVARVPVDPQQEAVALFMEGKFDRALPVFEDMISLSPGDKTLNYYLGACLIETGNYGARARQALLGAVGKDIPDKVNYYLGIAFHAGNDYLTALDYYYRFDKEAKSKVKKAVDYQRLIELCEQGVNPFVLKEKEIPAVVSENAGPAAKPADVNEIPADTVPAENFTIPGGLFDSVIVFQVNPEIRYMKLSQFKNQEAQLNFVKGWLKRQERDSVMLATDRLREQYTRSGQDEKQSLTEQILDNEQKIIALNRKIPAYNLLAGRMEGKYWATPPSGEMEKLIAQNQAIADSIELLHAEKQKRIGVLPPETVALPIVEKTEPEKEAPEEITKGIVYKIQIGAFSKEPPDWALRLFKKLSLIRKISNYTDEKGVTVYTTGELRSYADAVELQKQVKTEGIKNAIVAAYNNGIRIPVNEARKINGE
ncbi:MAG: tetratricopeptide repeat protein [Prolixibacteraceae bacterium]|jgi:tetratricopeptide (TPR) repeat protein|nr:tetratricopeptide repeat protein [Prolixibacteraceae bacterium]